MRVIYLGVFLLTLLAGAAFAQLPSGNVFVGYSYLSADTNTPNRANLNGWEGSVEKRVFPFLGLVGDISGHYGTERSSAGGYRAICCIRNCSVTLRITCGYRRD